ncbi:response regulator transcription factor [Rheinheimera pacifica]|uniref:Two-component response regulator, FixJ family, consists of REC and HTH domains n=1 Tax=Rheinheimera pacifica TaxID=173990 RepID=A0A1H6KBR8_9GAMM|nr:response regulator [Rheinheimera pacifica]SEH72678.1 Two-component response regulator, FixJ family, consists of REC and HTH domains [Rheinheimera pacifica]
MSGLVIVVEDEEPIRVALVRLLQSACYTVRAFASGKDFFNSPMPDTPACLLLDMQMPDTTGMDIIKKLASIEVRMPVIFITGFGSIPMSVQAMKSGAREFLTKPVCPETLLSAVADALESDQANLQQRITQCELTARYNLLTPREQQVLEFIIGGLLIKQIAAELEVSEITIKVHKRQIMEKMQTKSITDLVRITERLHITQARSR